MCIASRPGSDPYYRSHPRMHGCCSILQLFQYEAWPAAHRATSIKSKCVFTALMFEAATAGAASSRRRRLFRPLGNCWPQPLCERAGFAGAVAIVALCACLCVVHASSSRTCARQPSVSLAGWAIKPHPRRVQAYFLLITADFGHNFHIIAERRRAQKVAGMA